MKLTRLLVLLSVGWIVVLIVIPLALKAYRSQRPADMPAVSTVWVDAPAAPFTFYHGWWLGCWTDSNQQSNRCRLYGPSLNPPVVYEGRFLPCDGNSPIPMDALRIKPFADSSNMWIRPTGIAVVLRDGRILVPTEHREECAAIRASLEQHHELPNQTAR